MRKLRLAAYGFSLNLIGIAACLEVNPCLTVGLVDPESTDAQLCLDAFSPDVIAFELDSEFTELPIALLLERPGLLLVAIDRESEEMLVLSSRRAQPTTAAELVDVLLRTIAEPV